MRSSKLKIMDGASTTWTSFKMHHSSSNYEARLLLRFPQFHSASLLRTPNPPLGCRASRGDPFATNLVSSARRDLIHQRHATLFATSRQLTESSDRGMTTEKTERGSAGSGGTGPLIDGYRDSIEKRARRKVPDSRPSQEYHPDHQQTPGRDLWRSAPKRRPSHLLHYTTLPDLRPWGNWGQLLLACGEHNYDVLKDLYSGPSSSPITYPVIDASKAHVAIIANDH